MSRQLFRRYTDLPSAIDILLNNRLTLLPQTSWDDKNDLFCINEYKKIKSLKTLLSLCMTSFGADENGSRIKETYHHWSNFSAGGAGVCVQFNKKLLIESIPNEFSFKLVKYINSEHSKNININDLPFLKRDVFEDENEFRIIYENKEETKNFIHLKINTKTIDSVRISPWMPEALVESTIAALKKIAPTIPVIQSKLLNFEKWQQIVMCRLET